MKRIITENELIKKKCKLEFVWDNSKTAWIVKIRHLAESKPFTSVRVTMGGFDNFQLALDEAIRLFKRNMRNNITDRGVIKVTIAAEDVWPEIITEK